MNANTGKPRPTAQRAASSEPRELGEPKNSTHPAEACATTARVRATKRARSGTETEPPDHHDTEPPADAKACTAATAEAGPAPTPPGPNAHRHDTRAAGMPRPGGADAQPRTAASAPAQQPTTSERPDATSEQHTAPTSAEACGGSEREPATATTPQGLDGTDKHPGQASQRTEQTTGRSGRHTGRQRHLDRAGRHAQTHRRENLGTGGTRTGDRTPAKPGRHQPSEQPGRLGRADRDKQAGRRRREAARRREHPHRPHQPARAASDNGRGAPGDGNGNETGTSHDTPHEGRTRGGDAPRRATRPHRPRRGYPKREKNRKKERKRLPNRPGRARLQGQARRTVAAGIWWACCREVSDELQRTSSGATGAAHPCGRAQSRLISRAFSLFFPVFSVGETVPTVRPGMAAQSPLEGGGGCFRLAAALVRAVAQPEGTSTATRSVSAEAPRAVTGGGVEASSRVWRRPGTESAGAERSWANTNLYLWRWRQLWRVNVMYHEICPKCGAAKENGNRCPECEARVQAHSINTSGNGKGYKFARRGRLSAVKAAEYQQFLNRPRPKKKRKSCTNTIASLNFLPTATTKTHTRKSKKIKIRKSTSVWVVSGGAFESNRRRH